jgi:hypothetical protein
MVLAIYNSFSIPIYVTFKPPAAEEPPAVAIDFIIDMLFMFDIFLNFRTTFLHPKTGEEIFDPKEIARSYGMGLRFPLDLLSSFPFDFIAGLAGQSDSPLNIFGILKLLRIFRTGTIIMYLRVA